MLYQALISFWLCQSLARGSGLSVGPATNIHLASHKYSPGVGEGSNSSHQSIPAWVAMINPTSVCA